MLRTRHLVAAMLAACATGSALLPGTAGAAARLTAFSSCADLVEYAKRHALETIAGGPGQPGQVMPTTERGDAVQGEDFSSTNVQEPGVDEPDIVKTDGSTLFTVAGGRLRAVDARGAVPRVLGSLALPDGGDHQLLLRGERLLVLSNLSSPVPLPVDQGAAERIAPYPSRNAAVLTEVDVANPAAPRVVRRLRVDGRYLNARLTGSVARVMVTSTPRVFELPRPGGPPMADQPEVDDGGATLRAAIERSGPSDWVPSYTLEGGGPTVTRAAVDCQAVRRPPEFSGLDVLTVLTVDLAKGVEPIDSDGLMAAGETVYASPSGLYLASQRVPTQPSPAAVSTAIHRFDVSSATATEYRASGEVQGSLLNQFSLSEHAGNLRVATTVDPSAGQPAGRSQSFVTVLAERAGELAAAGRVGGLGRGERVFAVRFIGDTGYVVTFRQVDPLYTLDLSQPARPRVLGELKIRGYSSYLHPVGPDLLLGVGQDATDQGMVQGTQVSLFDVSNLTAPRRVARRALGTGASSEAEFDHHAFLYWPATRLAVLPLSISAPEGELSFSGALGLRVGAAGLGEVGRVSQPPAQPAPIRRTLVIGGRLFTVSDQGVQAASLATLTGGAFVRFS